MAIKVSGEVVIDDDRNVNAGIVTASSINVPPQVLSFSPTDNASSVSQSTNIVITFSANVSKGSGNITLRDGSASGDILETIAVSSGNVTLSGGAVTINPSSDIPSGKNVYVVVPAGAFTSDAFGTDSAAINDYNFSTGVIFPTAFSPADGATDVNPTTVSFCIDFNENICKNDALDFSTDCITLRAGSSGGTIRQCINVNSGSVSISNCRVTINPGNLCYEENTYIVVPQNAFLNTDCDANSRNDAITSYNVTTMEQIPPYGGCVICWNGSVRFIAAPCSAEVSRNWHQRSNAVTRAQAATGCSGWFVPNATQLVNPGWNCRANWDYGTFKAFWSNTPYAGYNSHGCLVSYTPTSCHVGYQNATAIRCTRAFRCLNY